MTQDFHFNRAQKLKLLEGYCESQSEKNKGPESLPTLPGFSRVSKKQLEQCTRQEEAFRHLSP